MRILQIHSPYRTAGGEDRVVRLEADTLRAAGHEVFQHVVPNPTRLGPTLRLLAQSSYNIGAGRTAVEMARSVGADLAHVHNTWFALSPSVPAALSRAGIPVVTTMHNYRAMCISGTLFRDGHNCNECLGGKVLPGVVHGCYENRGLSAIAGTTIKVHRLLRTWTDHTDVVLVPSETMRTIFVNDGFDPARITLKRNFTTDPGRRQTPPSDSRTVLFVGRLRPEKGIHALMDAWAGSAHSDLELVVVGDGSSRPELQATAPPRVRFTGPLAPPEVTALMLTARALIFSSLWREPFGLTLIEAMSAGLPVLGFGVGDAVRIVGDGGEFVTPGDINALSAAVDRLADGEFVDRLGRAGRLRYEEQFSPEAHLPALEQAYQAALDARKRREGPLS